MEGDIAMEPTTLVVGAVILVVLLLGAVMMTRKRQSDDLQKRFGPEYEHTVETFGDKRRAESELAARAKRVDKLEIRPLTAEETRTFSGHWMETQERFVDGPEQALGDAARLVKEVMTARGYPMGNFEQRAADISVDHAEVVSNYRAAREIELARKEGHASTEDMRQAMVHYRALLNELLEVVPEKEMAK
jgi:hypothetical protein